MTPAAGIRTGRKSALAFTSAALAIAGAAGWIFVAMHEAEPIIAGPGVTNQRMLGQAAPSLAGGPGDTPVFELAGDQPGGTIMILGGTHPPEISGMLAAVLLIENARVQKGRMIVVPQSNRSGFTYTEPMEGFPHRFEIDTPAGPRWFRVGMRLTNPAHQWPDPEIFVHRPSGEGMVGHETRNLNRNHPGREGGWLTAQVSHALMDLVKDSDVVIDLHEAYPEYPVINMMIAHENAFETAAFAVAMLQSRGIPMSLNSSPRSLHGLSHREFGDHAGVQAMLTETANPAMGRFRGRTDEQLVVEGRDPNYVLAADLGRLFVPFDEQGWPLKVRVARQLAAIQEVINSFNDGNPDSQILVEGIPDYQDVIDLGLGAFLRPPPGH